MKKFICIFEYKPRWEDITIPTNAEVLINIQGYCGIGSYSASYNGIEFGIAGFSLSSHFSKIN
jgi:hypothetical protein